MLREGREGLGLVRFCVERDFEALEALRLVFFLLIERLTLLEAVRFTLALDFLEVAFFLDLTLTFLLTFLAVFLALVFLTLLRPFISMNS
tara:strand:- start:3696 stop:3965 length:270 start_codon:yes stop_codon:yes gene_type:complete